MTLESTAGSQHEPNAGQRGWPFLEGLPQAAGPLLALVPQPRENLPAELSVRRSRKHVPCGAPPLRDFHVSVSLIYRMGNEDGHEVTFLLTVPQEALELVCAQVCLFPAVALSLSPLGTLSVLMWKYLMLQPSGLTSPFLAGPASSCHSSARPAGSARPHLLDLTSEYSVLLVASRPRGVLDSLP